MPRSTQDCTTGHTRDPVEPGPPPVAFVAAFVCPETERLGREVGFPIAVIAATADPDRHAARLAATLYGAWTPCAYEAWPLPFDEGIILPRDMAYRQLGFDARWMGSVPLPKGVMVEAGCLRVALPRGTCVADLAAILRAGLADLAIDRVARRPDRVRQRYLTRRPVVVAPRYALVTPGDIERVVVAEDLYRFGPGDLVTLAAAVALSVDSLALAAALGRGQVSEPAEDLLHG